MKTLQFPNQKPTPKGVILARTTLSILFIGFFAFIYLWGLKIQTESISTNYEIKMKELETQILANQKLAENKQNQLIDRISFLNSENKTISESSKKSAYAEVEDFLKAKLNPQVAELQPKK